MNSSNQTMIPSKYRFLGASLALALTCAVTSTASAVLVDGVFNSNEGYTNVQSIMFQLDNGTMIKDPGTLAWTVDGQGNVFVAFVQPLSINDNTYGTNSVGWVDKTGKPTTHTFGNLTGSDKAVFNLTNGAGQSFTYTLDYISQTSSAPSGYASLGVNGGDGSVGGGKKGSTGGGSATDVLKWGTSLDYNLNTLGFKTFIVDSPATTPAHNPDGSIDYSKPYANPANAPGWVYNIEYEFEISAAAFGPSGFAGVTVPFAHDSPSKFGQNTIIAVPEATNYLVGLAAVVFAGLFHVRQAQVRRKAAVAKARR
jgi:hypothetical protein